MLQFEFMSNNNDSDYYLCFYSYVAQHTQY